MPRWHQLAGAQIDGAAGCAEQPRVGVPLCRGRRLAAVGARQSDHGGDGLVLRVLGVAAKFTREIESAQGIFKRPMHAVPLQPLVPYRDIAQPLDVQRGKVQRDAIFQSAIGGRLCFWLALANILRRLLHQRREFFGAVTGGQPIGHVGFVRHVWPMRWQIEPAHALGDAERELAPRIGVRIARHVVVVEHDDIGVAQLLAVLLLSISAWLSGS